ncbi:MAG: Glutathione transport system permease protein GsiC [Chloroflexi bacterium ADurb.Bin325]|nr:MAG: Glutathione transport system permease protein GsiC [Chloroflexi bacterium ADurb.Bin325]
MTAYLLRRLGLILLTMLLASIVIFVATQILPGDVAQVSLGQFATEKAVENLRQELGLNRPAYVQYADWLTKFVRGDWGNSLTSRQPVRPMVMSRLRNSAMLAVIALALYVPLGIALGVLAALNREKLVDQAISALTMAFVGLPEFVTALLLIALFAFALAVLPANSSISPDSSFRAALPSLILPAITVSLTSLGYVARMTRASTIDVLRTDYVRAAELKGLPRMQVLFRHVLRNALLPTVTIVAMGIGYLIGGLIVTEQVFGYPGLGRLLVYAIQRRDLILIQACSMVVVLVFSLSNLAADLLYSFLNPRIRVGIK